MKLISNLLVFCFLISSCSHRTAVKEQQDNSLISQLTAEELKIHHCLWAANQSSDVINSRALCLKGTSFQVTRNPSSSQAEFVNINSWLFEDQGKLLRVFKTLKKLIKAQQDIAVKATQAVTHNRGFAVSGEAYFGLGVSWLAEFMVIDKKFGLFCAPGVSLNSDVGVELGVSLVQAFSCATNKSYEGGFLSLGIGMSGEAIGAPVGLELAYSLGVNGQKLKNSIKKAFESRELDSHELKSELALINSQQLYKQLPSAMPLFNFASNVLNILNMQPSSVPTPSIGSWIKKMKADQKSFGLRFKDQYRSPAMQNFLKNNRLSQTQVFLNLFVDSLTGCDSVGGIASLSLSLSPVSVGVKYENYKLLFELPENELKHLYELSPLLLLNPILLSAAATTTLVKISKEILALPSNIKNKCSKI